MSSSLVPLVFPQRALQDLTRPLADACAQGGTSFLTSGIDPGFANDVVPLALATACERVDQIRVTEILNYDTYDQPTVLFETMGFGKPESETPILLVDGVLGFAWGGTLHALAAGLGLELDEVRSAYERRTTDETFQIPCVTVAAGTVAALRFTVEGLVAGEPRVVVEHVTRLRDDLARDWPQPAGGGCYRVEITGEPRVTADVQYVGDHDGDHNTGGLIATAMRLVNTIPAVCEAPPGLLSALDLPLTPARG